MTEKYKATRQPEIVIVVQGGVLQEVVTSRRGGLRYRLIDLDEDLPFRDGGAELVFYNWPDQGDGNGE